MSKNSRNNRRKFQSVVKGNLRQFGTKAYKKFGQNFLLDKQYVNFMINGLDIKEDDFIIEIGPGMGALTEDIIKTVGKDRYLAIEIDIEKIIFLKQSFEGIQIENISILDFDVEKYCAEHGIKSYKIIGSLPFNISKLIIQKFSEIAFRPKKAVFMVQKEVGEDYIGEKSLTFLSIYLSLYWNVEDSQVVPSNAFFPAPKVDGLNMVLSSVNKDVNLKFLKFVKRGFASPRKKLGNVLALDKNNPFYDKRPHEITIEDWMLLFNDYLNKLKNEK